MKKILVWAVVGVMAFTMVPTSASAHHSGHRSGYRSGYRVCSVNNCTRTGVHKHNGIYYGGHYNGDGHGHNYGGRHH